MSAERQREDGADASPRPTPRHAPAGALALPLLLLLSLGLNLWGIGWGLPNDKSWSNDDPTPQTVLEIPSIWAGDWHKYPYLLPWIDRALYAPQLAAWRRDGSLAATLDCRIPADDDCFADVHAQWGRLMLISRVARAAMGTGTVWAVFLLAAALAGAPRARQAGLLAAAVAACSQVLVFYAHVGNVDVAMTFFFAWSLVAWQRALRESGLRAHAAFGALGGAALACKEAIYGAYVLPGAALVALAAWRTWRTWWPHDPHGVDPAAHATRTVRPLTGPLLAALAVLLVYVPANNVLGNPVGFAEHVRYWTRGTGIAPWNDGFAGHTALAWTFARRLGEGMSVPLLLLSAVGAALAMRRVHARWLLLPAASYYLFTIATVRFAYTRFTLPVVIVLAALAGVGLSEAWPGASAAGERGPRARFLGHRVARIALLLATAIGLGHGLLYSLHADLLLRADARYAAEEWLRANVPLEADIDTFGSRTHLPRLDWLGYDSDRIDEEKLTAAFFQENDDDRPQWLVLSEKTIGALEGAQATLRDRLLAGEAGYEVVLDAHGRSGLEPWLYAPWTESRINPRIWILRLR